MKKLIILVGLLALSAAPAIAAISGTAHDLSGSNAGTSDEVCVYCHTPHGADTSVTLAPLWNRSTADAVGSVYAGVDIQATMTIGSINQTDAPLCLSCHDGTVGEVLQNEPNNGTTDLTGYVFGSAAANLGTDMTNDHPVGFVYTNVSSADSGTDTEIKAKAVVEAVGGMEGALSYGAANNEMWCSSCHDVHDDTTSPFLRISNAGSALCTTCHSK